MNTTVVSVDPVSPDTATIARAAEILREGGLVAFPTETVYGLGVHALEAAAVAKVFAAKGRPARNPLIVHVDRAESAWGLAASSPAQAIRLAERFWPGPLTLVLERGERIPDIVTAGGATVALRVPAHPVALALLRSAQIPLAAPSANRSTRLSPTRAEHVLRDLDGFVDLVLDGGATPGGLESTVLDVSATPPRLLRPGLIAPAEIEAVVGPIQRASASMIESAPVRSPGIAGRHYAPRTPLELAPDDGRNRIAELRLQGKRVAWLTLGSVPRLDDAGVVMRDLPCDPTGYAAGLYAALHALDDAGVECIVVAAPPATEEWLAIRDRLCRAALS